MNKVIKITGGVIAGLLLVGACAGPTDTAVEETPETVAAAVEEAPAAEAAPEPEAAPELTVSQENALGSAESYLSFQNFSKEGLIKQLKFEGYSKADAKFAVNNVEVDWMEQAAGSAESYLSFQNFSKSGLIDQLKFEGYTQEQAEHGAESVGL